MADFRVSFFKLKFEKDEKGNPKRTGEKEYLGSVVVDDTGTEEYTVTAKAFRVCSDKLLYADSTVVEKL